MVLASSLQRHALLVDKKQPSQAAKQAQHTAEASQAHFCRSRSSIILRIAPAHKITQLCNQQANTHFCSSGSSIISRSSTPSVQKRRRVTPCVEGTAWQPSDCCLQLELRRQ